MTNTAPTFTVGTGIVSGIPIQSIATVSTQADGRILVSGQAPISSPGNSVLLRYNLNGSLDTSFGQGGMVFSTGDGAAATPITQVVFNGRLLTLADFSSDNMTGVCIAVQPDGKVLVTGTIIKTYSMIGSSTSFGSAVVARYNLNGTPDTSFGANGMVVSSSATWGYDRLSGSHGSQSSLEIGTTIAVQSDGQILIGTSGNSLQRYSTSGTLDKSFSTSPVSLDSSAAYTENGNPVVLNSAIGISDSELSAAQSYAGAMLTICRHDTASSQDTFTAYSGGTVTKLAAGSYFAVDGVTIGTVASNGSGALTLAFNVNATETLVDRAMEQIAYANSSDAPPPTVVLDWTFSDGNAGVQGSGGALSVVGNTTVHITPVNDPPALVHPLVSQTVAPGGSFSYNISGSSFSDPDGDLLTYRAILGDGTAFPPWLHFDSTSRTFSGTPIATDVHDYDIWVIATDPSGASTSDHFTLSVQTQLNGTSANDVLTGGPGPDSISGGDGSDWIYGGGGSDTLNGDAGNDYLYGQAGNDILNGGDGADIVSGGDGNDTLSGGNGDDGMYGDAGVDTLYGNGGGDFIAGGDGNDILHGDDGQDWIYGEWGDDTLYGDAGNDFLFGNFGNDTLIGGLGNDTFYGGEGGDTYVFAANEGEDFIVDFSVAQGDHISIASGTNGITTPVQTLAHVHDSGANAVVDLGNGNYVMLIGVATSSLHATDFVIA
jgi:uncharacterized delta-60 repeat protein